MDPDAMDVDVNPLANEDPLPMDVDHPDRAPWPGGRPRPPRIQLPPPIQLLQIVEEEGIPVPDPPVPMDLRAVTTVTPASMPRG